MISRIEGEIEAAGDGRALLRCGAISYQVLLTAADSMRIAASIGETVSFHTLHYLEGQGQGTSFVPRLIGFATESDRAFFELFTTVKGMGNRKALRALQLPFATVAEAIAARDVDLLKSLPEIGKRTAETIVVDLHEKVDRFVETGARATIEPTSPAAALATDAVAVLAQLGEPRATARQLVDRVLAVDPEIESAEEIVAAAYRLKEG